MCTYFGISNLETSTVIELGEGSSHGPNSIRTLLKQCIVKLQEVDGDCEIRLGGGGGEKAIFDKDCGERATCACW